MTCENCGSEDVVNVTMDLGNNHPVLFTACHTCDTRSWTSPEGRITLGRVLELTSANIRRTDHG